MLDLPPEQRRKVRIRGKPIKKRRANLDDWSREKIVAWAIGNHVKTLEDLERVNRKIGGPGRWIFRRVFGKWNEFTRAAYGFAKKQEPVCWKEKCDVYIIDLILMYGIGTVEQYKELHKRDPQICPPISVLKREFGNWSLALDATLRSTHGGNLKLYLVKRKELGKWPTLGQCVRMSIDLSNFIAIQGSKEELDKFLERVEKMDENEN